MAFGTLSFRGKQPPRDPKDDYLVITVIADKLEIRLQNEGTSIMISERNAWTLIGLLSLFVGLKLPEKIGKRIML